MNSLHFDKFLRKYYIIFASILIFVCVKLIGNGAFTFHIQTLKCCYNNSFLVFFFQLVLKSLTFAFMKLTEGFIDYLLNLIYY